MENALIQNNQDTNTDGWVKPEVKLFQITEETLGQGGAGFDFASEAS
ncbi:hypothetical protein [Emticicia fontis]